DRLHGQRHVALGVRLGDRDLERDGAEREPVHALDDRDAQRAAAGDGAVADLEAFLERAAPAGDDGRHVGRHDDDQRLDREDRDERDGEEDRADDDTEHVERHCRLRSESDGRGYSSSRSRYGATYAMPSLTSTTRTEVQVSLSSAASSSGRASSSISRPARCTRILPLPCASGRTTLPTRPTSERSSGRSPAALLRRWPKARALIAAQSRPVAAAMPAVSTGDRSDQSQPSSTPTAPNPIMK